ncbi:uncharacterized protein [Tenebrio molitor]|jgi:hypothetical protein|uniref:uncharacterized protein isoform X9 n=1 Tax=Tenebrio molitor TaxID=7067 RepID=UPI0036247DFF
MTTTLIAAIIVGAACVSCFVWAACLKFCNKDKTEGANQQEDIYNISSRVQGQGQWPTHDAHVSLDNFAITNELNKYNDDPPTYEEAMSIATSINNNTVVPAVVPKTTITPTSTTATSTSN